MVDIAEVDRLLTTTKQVRKRLDLSRPVSIDQLLEIIEIADHAADGRQPRAQPMVDRHRRRRRRGIAERFADVGGCTSRPCLRSDDRSQKVIDSAEFLVEHLAEVLALVIAMRLDRPPLDPATQGDAAAYYGSVLPGVWSFQLAARARGVGSAWTTFHLGHEAEIAELLGIPPTVTQVSLLAVGYYTGETFTPAPRRPAREVTFLNGWKAARRLSSPGDDDLADRRAVDEGTHGLAGPFQRVAARDVRRQRAAWPRGRAARR